MAMAALPGSPMALGPLTMQGLALKVSPALMEFSGLGRRGLTQREAVLRRLGQLQRELGFRAGGILPAEIPRLPATAMLEHRLPFALSRPTRAFSFRPLRPLWPSTGGRASAGTGAGSRATCPPVRASAVDLNSQTKSSDEKPPSTEEEYHTSSPIPGIKHIPTWKAHLDFKWIRDNKEAVEENIRHRKSTADVTKVVSLYEQFVAKTMEVDALRAERNKVASAMKQKLEAEERQRLVDEGKRLKDQVAALEEGLQDLQDELNAEGQRIPNMTHPDVPQGGDENMKTLRQFNKKPEFSFPPKDHVELGLALDIVDFDSAAEVSGTKFYYLRNEGVLLEMALINWALAQLMQKGFTPVTTPDLVRSNVVEKCGFQPRASNTQVYSVENMDLCLAGTAEIPVGGLFMDKILKEAELPAKVVAFSHCFRTEAGAAGAATRGLYRVHQFSKLEMFVVARPEDSDALHKELISIEEELYSSLGLHFETRDMPSEDLGAPAYRKFDVEAWMPGLNRYGEISSASNCTDYQARRLNIRYRPSPAVAAAGETENGAGAKGGKGKGKKQAQAPPRFAHTLNATAVAVPRMIISILETFQQEDGSVLIPEPLQPFMGGRTVLKPKANAH